MGGTQTTELELYVVSYSWIISLTWMARCSSSRQPRHHLSHLLAACSYSGRADAARLCWDLHRSARPAHLQLVVLIRRSRYTAPPLGVRGQKLWAVAATPSRPGVSGAIRGQHCGRVRCTRLSRSIFVGCGQWHDPSPLQLHRRRRLVPCGRAATPRAGAVDQWDLEVGSAN